MAELAVFAFVLCITALLVAGWIRALLTGRAALIGPFVRADRAKRPVGYALIMGLLLLPITIGIIATIVGAQLAFPLEHIPAPQAAGYAEPSQLRGRQRAEAVPGYFPASLSQTSYTCRDIDIGTRPILGEMEVAWYSSHLSAAGEPSLLEAVNPEAPTQDVYRFTWLRSFDKPIVIRIEQAKSGALLMTASRLSGMGGYEPGSVEARIVRGLSQDEANQFRRALSVANGLRLRAVSCDWGFDGAQWIFEGVDRGRYRYVERWTPDRGSVRALGLVMLSFTGWEIEPVY
ncbi:hypothetical protein [Phenylobacterium sp.]|uniref:hypothetical protein n=1 Tax=Phenylobacterium sp. TaxID=1871053 RepID=UPI003002C298